MQLLCSSLLLHEAVLILFACFPKFFMYEQFVFLTCAVCHAQALRTTGARVFGTPASFSALQSRCVAAWHAMGPWTMAVNLNPTDMNSHLVFKVIMFPLGWMNK